MPDAKITALASIGTGSDPANDPLVIVDVSDTSMAASGTTKKVTINNLLASGPAATLASVTVTGPATVGTTLGVTGAATFTGGVVCNGAVTLGDAVGDAVTVTGSFTSYTGQNPSAIRAAASDYAAVAFDGATTSTRIVSACQALGTGDFSLWSRFRVPTSFANNPGVLWLTDVSTGTFRANAIGIYLDPGANTLRVFRYGATPATDNRIATVASFLTNFVGQVVDVVVTRAGNTLKIYINGTDTAYIETSSGTAPAWGQTVVSDFALVGAQNSTTIFTGRIYRSVVFNRALSASDVTELITTGVNPADQWGTQTAVYTSNWSAGTDSWAAGAGTATGNIDAIGSPPRNDTLRAVPDTSNNVHSLTRSSLFVAGKRFLLTGSAFIPSGQTNLNRVEIQDSGSLVILAGTNLTPNASWQSFNVEFVARGTGVIFYAMNGGAYTYTGNGTDLFYLEGLSITRIGAIVDLDFTVGAGYQATDRSTNNLHGTLFNGVEFTVPRRMAVVYGTTSTATSQLMLGSFSIPTNAIIEDIIVNSSGTATISIGPVTGGSTTIVNAASVVAGRQKLTIATPFSTSGNLYVTSSTTAVLQFTILYTVAA